MARRPCGQARSLVVRLIHPWIRLTVRSACSAILAPRRRIESRPRACPQGLQFIGVIRGPVLEGNVSLQTISLQTSSGPPQE